jgi:hypothetical protein
MNKNRYTPMLCIIGLDVLDNGTLLRTRH